ncbi:MAG: cell division protein ZapA [Clostridia bacterium]|nr:cell division protein ZapA [Clostridia bacterium]
MEEKMVKTTIRLLGNDYDITSSDSEEYIHRVAFYVDKKLSEIASRNTRLSTNMAAVLASVNIADELFKLREEMATVSAENERVTEKMSEIKQESEILKRDNEILRQEIQRLKIEIAKLEVQS